jgi:hypothetical protein
MATLTKNTSEVQDIILSWAFENVSDWHDGLIDHMSGTRLDTCYEESRQLLVDKGHTSIPASKEETIILAHNSGFLMSMVERQAAAEAASETP